MPPGPAGILEPTGHEPRGIRLNVRLRKDALAHCTADVGHHPLKQCIVGRPVVDEVVKPVVVQVRIDPTVDGPDCIVLVGEFRSKEIPGDGL